MSDNKCDHMTTEDYKDWEYDDDYNKVYFWTTREVSACVDIDLHRYKCSKCGEIGYYSGRARNFYEGRTKEI